MTKEEYMVGLAKYFADYKSMFLTMDTYTNLDYFRPLFIFHHLVVNKEMKLLNHIKNNNWEINLGYAYDDDGTKIITRHILSPMDRIIADIEVNIEDIEDVIDYLETLLLKLN